MGNNELKDLGDVVATARLHDFITENKYFRMFIEMCLSLYLAGDWGVLSTEDWEMNDISAREGGRIVASYPVPKDLMEELGCDEKIWIITEEDRSMTTILFPSEY